MVREGEGGRLSAIHGGMRNMEGWRGRGVDGCEHSRVYNAWEVMWSRSGVKIVECEKGEEERKEHEEEHEEHEEECKEHEEECKECEEEHEECEEEHKELEWDSHSSHSSPSLKYNHREEVTAK